MMCISMEIGCRDTELEAPNLLDPWAERKWPLAMQSVQPPFWSVAWRTWLVSNRAGMRFLRTGDIQTSHRAQAV